MAGPQSSSRTSPVHIVLSSVLLLTMNSADGSLFELAPPVLDPLDLLDSPWASSSLLFESTLPLRFDWPTISESGTLVMAVPLPCSLLALSPLDLALLALAFLDLPSLGAGVFSCCGGVLLGWGGVTGGCDWTAGGFILGAAAVGLVWGTVWFSVSTSVRLSSSVCSLAKLTKTCKNWQYITFRILTPANSQSWQLFFLPSPGRVWSVTQRSRGFPAPQSCWPARQIHEPGSSRAMEAGTAARSRVVPSTRCWERTLPCSRWRDSLDLIYCRRVEGWWCSHHRTCQVKSRGKREHRLNVITIDYWGICKTPMAIKWKFSRVKFALCTCSWGAAPIQDIGTCRWPWWPFWCREPHIPPYWRETKSDKCPLSRQDD